MSKHKRFHRMRGKGAERKAYAFFHAGKPYGSVGGLARMGLGKKELSGATSAGQPGQTRQSPRAAQGPTPLQGLAGRRSGMKRTDHPGSGPSPSFPEVPAGEAARA